MIRIFKSLFTKKKKEEYIPDPPGRTFNRVQTGDYFGCDDMDAEKHHIAEVKQKKIDQITELKLIPMFIRYSYRDLNQKKIQASEDHSIPEISSVHVAFQKEISSQKGQMTHVTEISFIVMRSDFDEFEKMASVSLNNDFRDLTDYNDNTPFTGGERRKKRRER